MTRSAIARARIAATVLLIAGAVGMSACTATVGEVTDAGPPTPAASEAPDRPADAFAMIVESVHDGDTLRAHVTQPNDVVTDTGSTRIRLLGIDTPEISPDLECWGSQATAMLEELAPTGATIWVSPDIEVRDQYDRHLLYLWTADGTFINAELVAQGAARVEVYAPNDLYEPLLRSLEADAQSAGVGRWGACG